MDKQKLCLCADMIPVRPKQNLCMCYYISWCVFLVKNNNNNNKNTETTEKKTLLVRWFIGTQQNPQCKNCTIFILSQSIESKSNAEAMLQLVTLQVMIYH